VTRKVSVAEAKGKLPSIIHEVEGGSRIEITRHGKSVAVIVPTGEYERLREKGKGFWNDLEKVRRIMASEGISVKDTDFRGLRDNAGGRSFEWAE